MRDLRKDLRQYLDLRRALGFKLRKHEPRLTEFIGFLKAQSTDRITRKLAITWATESSKGHKHSCCERLRIVRSFARHMSSMDARTEIPPTGTLRQRQTALRPHIYTSEEIDRLMTAAHKLFSPRGLRCHTYHHLIGLLATTGIRSGEAVRLAEKDQLTHPQRAWAYIQAAKFLMASRRPRAVELLNEAADESRRIESDDERQSVIVLGQVFGFFQ